MVRDQWEYPGLNPGSEPGVYIVGSLHLCIILLYKICTDKYIFQEIARQKTIRLDVKDQLSWRIFPSTNDRARDLYLFFH